MRVMYYVCCMCVCVCVCQRILLDQWPGPPENLAGTIYTALSEEKCRIAVLPPSIVDDLAAEFEKIPENTYKLYFVGFMGEKVDSLILTSTFRFAHIAMLNYVSAELLLTSVCAVSEPVYRGCGELLQPGILSKVVDEDGVEITSDKLGNLLIRSPCMFKCYLNDPKATEAAFTADGYFKTGDLGKVMEGDHHVNPQDSTNE
ncbi:uncharacterized protein LOC143300078 [Babylonia areolata]|uniref:uncharacterized protein LOC143300078 n=1 Tax=Babylonia areolata TaxID=304850 RepID=UPI003FD035D0